jgi:hypothetical protein
VDQRSSLEGLTYIGAHRDFEVQNPERRKGRGFMNFGHIGQDSSQEG